MGADATISMCMCILHYCHMHLSHVNLEIGYLALAPKYYCCAGKGYKLWARASVAGCQEWLGIKLPSGQNTLNCGCHCDYLITALCNLTSLVLRPLPSFLSLAVHLPVLQATGSWVRPCEWGYNLTWSTSWFGSQTLLVQGRNEGRKALVNNSVLALIQSACTVFNLFMLLCFVQTVLVANSIFGISTQLFQISQLPLDKPITIKNGDIMAVELRLRLANMSVFLSLTMTTGMRHGSMLEWSFSPDPSLTHAHSFVLLKDQGTKLDWSNSQQLVHICSTLKYTKMFTFQMDS